MSSRLPTSAISAPEDAVFGLSDLERWPWEGESLAVVGFPVGHSISPHMHNAALRAMAKDESEFGNWRYFKFAVPPEDLAQALPLFHAKKFRGLNLTIPHKILALQLVEKTDRGAAATGAINTLRWTIAGYEGFNTDGYGLAQGIATAFGVGLAGADVVVLGAGGAARAAAVLAVQQRCRRLFLGNRTPEKLEPLRHDLEHLAGKSEIVVFPLSAVPGELGPSPVVINATSAGLKPEDQPPVDVRGFPPGALIYDMIYNPAEPALVREARRHGLQAANGLSMLVHQGVRALEIWSGRKVPVAEMERAATTALSNK